jgi:signal transduction histidine kinase
MGDTRALRQIALNLLSNAVKFTPLNGKVDVTLQFENGMAILVVEDTGIGIAPHDQVSVFEPFRQVDASVRRRHEGTGLGLAITRRLVEMHGGTIDLASELGVGTRLEIRIPTVRAQSNSGPIAEAAA